MGKTVDRLKGVAALVAAGLLVQKIASIVAPEPQVGYWRSREGFETYRAAYDAAMATLPPPTRTRDVPTEYGTVRVYEWAAAEGADAGLPVVLLPGNRSGTPMWAENLTHWIGKRTLFAMDAVGDSGLSTQSVPFTSFEDRAAWVEQALAELGLTSVHLVGHSFGGAVAAHHTLGHPGRVASLTLLEPVLVLYRLPVSMFVWSALLALPVSQGWKDYALAEIGGVPIAKVRERTPLSAMVDAGAKHYRSHTLIPRTLTDAEWQSMSLPIRIDIAADKSLAGGDEAANRAIALGKQPVTVWPETTHSLPMQAAERLGSELIRYWATHDL
ncbi:alpha/beta hydrolase [Nocardia callitridis]|uniref:Alpha/beta hydrolase n=1 Tax=Nocardia callitridis TaxID=648753 RepID=A0ABP9KJ44_9NOCA